jgi:hypothetical protein
VLLGILGVIGLLRRRVGRVLGIFAIPLGLASIAGWLGLRYALQFAAEEADLGKVSVTLQVGTHALLAIGALGLVPVRRCSVRIAGQHSRAATWHSADAARLTSIDLVILPAAARLGVMYRAARDLVEHAARRAHGPMRAAPGRSGQRRAPVEWRPVAASLQHARTPASGRAAGCAQRGVAGSTFAWVNARPRNVAPAQVGGSQSRTSGIGSTSRVASPLGGSGSRASRAPGSRPRVAVRRRAMK